ncbi:septation protein SpoVG family protein [Planctomycetaceae bacterium SH139]
MEGSEDRLRAFCSVTFDHSFVVRDLKIIDGVNGPFVAMPSRKLTGHCPRCGHKNHLRAQYCNQCGVKVRGSDDASHDSPQKLYADVAHPINSECREMIQKAVIDELEEELARAGEPGYRSRYDDEFSVSELSDEVVADLPVREQPVRQPSEGRSSPPPPHFDRVRKEDNVKRSGPTVEEDGFGAGIFDS